VDSKQEIEGEAKEMIKTNDLIIGNTVGALVIVMIAYIVKLPIVMGFVVAVWATATVFIIIAKFSEPLAYKLAGIDYDAINREERE